MAVTIGHGYTPVQTTQSVEYEYTVTVDDTSYTQLGAPAYYDGIMRFAAGDIYLTRDDTVCDQTDCSYTDSSDDVWHWYVDYDSGYYRLKYAVNGDPPTVRLSSQNPIYFGWYAAGGATWNDGIMPGFRANITCRAMYIAGTTTRFNEFSGGNVRVETRVSQTQTNRLYEIVETVTTTQQGQRGVTA